VSQGTYDNFICTSWLDRENLFDVAREHGHPYMSFKHSSGDPESNRRGGICTYQLIFRSGDITIQSNVLDSVATGAWGNLDIELIIKTLSIGGRAIILGMFTCSTRRLIFKCSRHEKGRLWEICSNQGLRGDVLDGVVAGWDLFV
jgi:hypothetical protein